MMRIYELDIRVLLMRDRGRVVARPLELEGSATGTVQAEALASLLENIQNRLEADELRYQEAAPEWVAAWKAAESGSIECDDAEAVVLKVWGIYGVRVGAGNECG